MDASSVQLARHIYVIGEIGINHNGDLKLAKKLIDLAKVAGCDAVKFQKRTLDIVYTQELLDSPRESPWGTTQREQKEGLEFGRADYDEIHDYCQQVGIDWFASAWDIPSQEFLRPYDLKFNKIASAMTTHLEFVEVVAAEGKPTFLSTGMCTLEEIEAAVALFKKHNCPFVLMHTVSEYPSPEETLNLKLIPELQNRFDCPVGYSGHESSVSPSLMAAMMGIVALERHITLDRAMYGSDQAASLEAAGLITLVAQLRKIPVVMGDGVKKSTPVEDKVAGKLRYWL
ncbi:MAG: N-acetylneuraminate synthase family protein [Magnetococcales bacterium]|nr:N-acetylneuraminate synthase family protein [Magnetococcales bacterium]